MNYFRIVLFGIIIWLVAFISSSVFFYLGVNDALYARLITVALLGIAAYLFGFTIREESLLKALNHTFIWLVIAALLDVITAFSFIGFSLFSRWDVWLGYLFILILPLYSAR